MNTSSTNPKREPGADLRAAAVQAMLESMKESLLPRAPGQEAERAARTLATLKLAKQGLETFPVDKKLERALRSAERVIREQERWLAECERRQREGE